jgi:hypothetical protein
MYPPPAVDLKQNSLMLAAVSLFCRTSAARVELCMRLASELLGSPLSRNLVIAQISGFIVFEIRDPSEVIGHELASSKGDSEV